MRTHRFVLLFASLFVVWACGGKGPTAPSSTAGPSPSPSPTTARLCLVDDLAAPIAGATIGLTGPTGGEEWSTDASGCVDVPSGWTVNFAQAAGFRRLTDFPRTREDVALPVGTYALWPARGYLEHLEEIDEWSAGSFGYASYSGYRPKTGRYTVSIPPEIAGHDPADQAMYRAALDALLLDAGAQASNKVTFVVTTGPAAIEMTVDPSTSRGYFSPTLNDRYITGGQIKIHSLETLIDDPAVVRHELGHFLGVGHVIDNPSRLMYRSSGEFTYATEEELIHFRMRFLRPVGFDPRKG